VMLSGHDAIAVGNGGTIRRTTDGGNSWLTVIGTSRAMFGLCFPDSTTGYAVGNAGYLLRTTDQGITWSEQLSRVSATLRGVSFISPRIGTAVGDNGTIIHTTMGGVFTTVMDREYRTPSKMDLAQNYPNPFNPSTTISFSLASSSHVTLKVYDLLGREVATLVDEDMNPGNYSRPFVAKDHSTGVYFYRLQAGDFNQTRKLMLIK
jgi:hypothetical protein